MSCGGTPLREIFVEEKQADVHGQPRRDAIYGVRIKSEVVSE